VHNRRLTIWAEWMLSSVKGLVEPVEAVHDPAERIRARFLATLFLLSALCIVVFLTLRYGSDSSLPNHVMLAVIAALSGALMLIPYRLAVVGNTHWANRTLLAIVTFLVFGLASNSEPAIVTRTLNYLLALVLFASHFASARFTLGLSGVQMVGMVYLLSFYGVPPKDIVVGPVAFHLTITVLMVLFAYYRGRIEVEHRAELAQSELRYRTVLERMPIYSYAFHRDAEGKLVKEWVTESFRTITGYTWEEVIAMGVKPLYHLYDAERQDADAQRAYQEPTEGEYRIITKSGEVRWIHLLRHSVRDPDNQHVLHSYGIGQDITARKLADEREMKAAIQRERLVVMNDFVQAISHDFRTSLATIETSRYLLYRQLSEEQRQQAEPRLNVIQHFVFHMEEQLHNLRSITALANLALEPCDLNGVVQSVIAEPTIKAKRGNHQIDFQPDPDLPTIQADSQEMGRAIKHVVINALSYMAADGIVTIRTYSAGEQAAVEISDTGIGITQAQLAHIFDFFYRGEAARPLNSGGVGLGLSIVRIIIEAHGGSVKVESVVNQGSTFTLFLPLSSPEIIQD
jgi:PAS domain S-box-containing protein